MVHDMNDKAKFESPLPIFNVFFFKVPASKLITLIFFFITQVFGPAYRHLD